MASFRSCPPVFLSTPSGWRATAISVNGGQPPKISIHALRVEGDHAYMDDDARILQFLSTPSGWRATYAVQDYHAHHDIFLSTPSGWRATFNRDVFNPEGLVFLSTPSGWRATWSLHPADYAALISIHALRVEGDYRAAIVPPMFLISIHALRVEGDNKDLIRAKLEQIISIHALRVEGDLNHLYRPRHGTQNVYPRPPGGGRQWRETYLQEAGKISIHALRVEGDKSHR